ncbi:MAG TPA: hybrid sensor histidine kinase/response regulator [Sandaracinaceae bacterium LLY-WYZ-13_1]|nr:hybrid sensor histidine kinase/response regulator [Sandaracinaceae bacterium LLY-WYZ-13_1]
MLPVSTDLLAWIAEELALTLLEDGPEGARAIAGAAEGSPERSLASQAAAAAQLDEPPAALEALIEGARAGIPGSLSVGDASAPSRVLAWPTEDGHAAVLVAPHAAHRQVARRAAAADLAAGVTHEVANALTAIAGWTRMAASGGPLPDRTRQALDVVQRSAKEALGSARGLLRTMRDTGRPEVPANSSESADVADVVEEVLETLRPELEEAGIRLSSRLSPGVEGTTPTPALRLVVSNLVRNAFEALERGGSIRVALQPRGDRFCLTVVDDGPGMDRETLARAFDRYFTTKADGTGLGLALVRDTVHEAGGRLEVQSRRGSGTRFEVWLPRAGAADLSMRPPKVTTASSGVHPKPFVFDQRFLVVDDDEAMRSMVRTALELQGAQVSTASGLEDALATEGSFDVALVDLGLGDGRGDALLARLRAADRIRHAVILTGSAEPELDAAGAPDAVLRKPFELEDLNRVLEALLGQEPLEAEG